jgi:Ca2+-binding EF-hand superfamily protein
LNEVFTIFDRNGEGHVTRHNLTEILQVAFGDFIAQEEIDSMITEADTNFNNTIEAGEFRDVMMRHKENPDPSGWGRLKLFD